LKSTIDPRYGEIPKNLIPVKKYRQIPVLGEIACGDPILAEENIEEYREEIDENLHKNNPKTNNTLFFECSVFG
jgi:repressor LexA